MESVIHESEKLNLSDEAVNGIKTRLESLIRILEEHVHPIDRVTLLVDIPQMHFGCTEIMSCSFQLHKVSS